MSMTIEPTRLEHDSLGERHVPASAYYGVQTLRAAENFDISGITIAAFPALLRALAMVKKAAALANAAEGYLPEWKCQAITAACDDVIAGLLPEAAFPVDVLQGGAGTSTNMNMNEVLANRALEHLGKSRGDYAVIHPNDDVNLSQSTNDVYPTAVRLAIVLATHATSDAVERLAAAFDVKSREFADVVTLGRTQLQDAVPITLGEEFGAFAVTLREDRARLREATGLLREVNLGGTAVGTRINATPAYAARAIAELSELCGEQMIQAENLVEASWDAGAFVMFSGVLKRLATKLSKISNDLRLLSSGPRGGLGEIRLPPVQPGSSIMPGKVNPVIPEAVNQVCFQVIGNDLAVTMAAEAGQLQLNAFEPSIGFNLLTSLRLLGRAADTLAEKCVLGIEADAARCRALAESSIALATALNPLLGYEGTVRIAKMALATGRTVRDIAIEAGVAPEAADRLLDPLAMARS
jgi:aspartate ammonia-lyase